LNSVKYIFAQPDYIEGIGNVYPIKLKDYDKYQECSKLLYISKNNFVECDIPLLGLVFLSVEQLNLTEEQLITSFEELFSLVLKKEVKLKDSEDIFWFEILDNNKHKNTINNRINFNNYDILRSIIMKQNLIFEPKVYKNKIVQEWANKVLEARAKSSEKITMEDFITTVKNFNGLTYDQIMEQTIYQIYADFYRISKIKKFDQSNLFATVSTEAISIEHFAQNINMFESPYDNLFVDSSKLNKLNSLTK
jgi:hypothetical protein